MSQPLARLYDLALRALDEQERRADALRGRLAPVLAAAALGASLLSAPVVGGAHPASAAGKAAIAASTASLLVAAAAAFRVLAERRLSIDRLDPHALMVEFRASEMLDDEAAFYATMLARLRDHFGYNAVAIERLAAAFTVMLWAILVMLCGLTVAVIVG
jgi:hypothetical protein